MTDLEMCLHEYPLDMSNSLSMAYLQKQLYEYLLDIQKKPSINP